MQLSPFPLYLVPLRSKYSQRPILKHPQPTSVIAITKDYFKIDILLCDKKTEYFDNFDIVYFVQHANYASYN